MGRAEIARTIKELERRIVLCKHAKKRSVDFLERLREKLHKKEISHHEYERTLSQKIDGRTFKEWFEYYDNYLENCRRQIIEQKRELVKEIEREKAIQHRKKHEVIFEHKKRVKKHKFLIIFSSVFIVLFLSAIVAFLFLAYSNINPSLTGAVVGGKTAGEGEQIVKEVKQEFSQALNIIFENSADYEWTPENYGILNSVKISGNIAGEGNIKVYLDNILILDKTSSSISSVNSSIDDSIVNSVDSINSSINQSDNQSYSEQQTGINGRPSQPQPVSENTINKLENAASNESSANVEETIIAKEFTDVCSESCSLENFRLNKSSYNLRIEISGDAKLNLESIRYEITSKKQVKKAEEEKKVVENITITTQLGVLQQRIEINKPVKWKKNIKALNLDEAKKSLPKSALSISGKKISDGEFEFNYETPAPEAREENIARGKRVIISAPDELNYTNVLAHTTLTNEVNAERIHLYHLVNDSKEEIAVQKYDTNNNSLIDYIEWSVPHLSEQTYELIIEISKAEHLDENKVFISDIYEQVKALDGVWSEIIPNTHYIRVVFEKNLTNKNDITIYPRITSGNPKIEVYEIDGTTKIAEFSSLNLNQYNKIYLTNLISESQDSFDLKVVGGSVEIEHIIDPTPSITLVPTEGTGTYGTQYVGVGGFPENILGVNMTSLAEANGACYAAINVSGGAQCASTAGSGSVDGALAWNITLPTYSSLNSVLLTSIQSQLTSGSDQNSIMLFNFTKKQWVYVNSTGVTADGINSTLTFNISSALLSSYVSGNRIMFVARTNGTATTKTQVSVDFMSALISYTETTAPNLVINFPVNATKYTINVSNMTYTISDQNLESCWWSLNNGTTNTTQSPCLSNNSGLTSLEGTNTWWMWANDTSNNINSSFVVFFKDTIKPATTIVYPANTSYGVNVSNLNYTYADANPDSCWYSNNSGVWNSTKVAAGANFTHVKSVEGSNTYTLYCNDTFGNLNSTTKITFVKDTAPPNIGIISPELAKNYTTTTVEFNVTVDQNGSWCGFALDASANITMTKFNDTYFNYINTSTNQGWHNITFACNDTLGNFNVSSGKRVFAVDTAGPTLANASANVTSLNLLSWFCVNATATDSFGVNFVKAQIWNSSTFINYTMADTGTTSCDVGAGDGVYGVIIQANNTGVWNYSIVFANDTNNNWNSYDFADLTINVNDIFYPQFSLYTDNNASLSGSGVANFTVIILNTNGTVFLGINGTNYSAFNETANLYNLSIGLTNGTYDYYWSAYGNGTSHLFNTSALRSYTINDTAANTAPKNPVPKINSSDYSNKSNQNLYCYDILSDPDADNRMNVTVLWYNQTSLHLIRDYNQSYANATAFNAMLNAGNTTKGENWSCSMRLFDGTAFSDWINSSNLSILNTPPQVITVFNNSATDVSTGPTEAPALTNVIINFSVYDDDGAGDLNLGIINFSLANEDTRENASCAKVQASGSYANYSCNVTMWWWDATGDWLVNAYASDADSGSDVNTSSTLYVGLRTSFVMSPSALTWLGIGAGATNQTSNNDPLVLNNTGNDDITADNIQINATDLKGETDSNLGLWAGNFSAYWATGGATCIGANCLECAGTGMNKSTLTGVVGANLSAGNYTKNDGHTGQEQIYLCLRYAGAELTITQPYSTYEQGSWTVKIISALALVYVSGRKVARKKLKKKNLHDENLNETINVFVSKLKQEYLLDDKEVVRRIINRLRDEYNLSRDEIDKIIKQEEFEIPVAIFSKKLGCLESLTKYMKENLNMSYHEIAKELNRDDRTIWTAYKKSQEKQRELLSIKETKVLLPISIFKDRRFTVFESIVWYLRGKGMKYSEIAELLDRNQRNIWTVYSRAVIKLNKKV